MQAIYLPLEVRLKIMEEKINEIHDAVVMRMECRWPPMIMIPDEHPLSAEQKWDLYEE